MYQLTVENYMHELSLEEKAKMPSCNLAETVHNRWLQLSRNTMIYLYEATNLPWTTSFVPSCKAPPTEHISKEVSEERALTELKSDFIKLREMETLT